MTPQNLVFFNTLQTTKKTDIAFFYIFWTPPKKESLEVKFFEFPPSVFLGGSSFSDS